MNSLKSIAMKIKDLIDELSKYDENTEVFVNDEEGHERVDIKFDVLKDKLFLYDKIQPIVIRLIGEDSFKKNIYH